MPERAIDTIVLRNLDKFCRWMFGEPAHFLFNSMHYWGGFDVACILSSGRVVFIESKKKRASVADFRKFLIDIQKVRESGLLYLAHRWQHHMDNWQEYRDGSIDMFGSFFMKLRSETLSPRCDPAGRAARKLRVSRRELQRRHDASNDWLDCLKEKAWHGSGYSGLYEFLKARNLQIREEDPLFVFLAPDTDPDQIASWRREIRSPAKKKAWLVNYRFWKNGEDYPQYISIQKRGIFQV